MKNNIKLKCANDVAQNDLWQECFIYQCTPVSSEDLHTFKVSLLFYLSHISETVALFHYIKTKNEWVKSQIVYSINTEKCLPL